MLQEVVTKDQYQVAEPAGSEPGSLEVFEGIEAESTSSEPDMSDLGGSQEDLLSAQIRGPIFIPAREQTTVLNGEPQHREADVQFHHFAVNHD